MCGIAGILSEKPLEGREIAELCLCFSENMQHRGPDDEGFVLIDENGNLSFYKGKNTISGLELPHISEAKGRSWGALVHRRLSILGLGVLGHQPMDSEHFVLSYNGETFNYAELNSQFGFENTTATDTETVLQLLNEKGIAGLDEMEGFFAGIAYNKSKKAFHIFRDVTGVKPLYTAVSGGIKFWCSETKALRKATQLNAINPRTFFYYFVEGLLDIGENTTVFAGLQEFPKGEIHTHFFQSREHHKAELEKRGLPPVDLQYRFKHSIEQRLVADVPLGFAVSGGLDSAAIIGMARNLNPEADIQAFSVVSDDGASDESKWQKSVVDFNKAEWHRVNISKVDSHALQNTIQATDLPVVAWNNIAHFELCKLVKNSGVTVLFNGQGADEIFGGYPDYLQRAYRKLGSKIRKSKNWPLELAEIKKGYRKFWIQNHLPNSIKPYLFQNKFKSILHPDFLLFPSKIWTQSSLGAEEKMEADYYGFKLGQMLLWEDRNGMANSLESRNPFADDRNLAAFLRIPFHKKISNGFTKGILRDVLKDIVPDEVLWRTDKQGFTVPDSSLTWKYHKEWKDLFFSSELDMYSGQKQREQLWSKLQSNSHIELQQFFRLASFSQFIEHVKHG
ncbi:MAG: asparagine synthase (glutamine-hydrolyzing) [Bacteroidia bacterium]|nr:asparagine synthase (glutamine-hydrolyzing) [Bacteroidia bacterium]